MSDPMATDAGVLEGSSRVLRELLRSPRTRQSLAVLLDHLDPDNAGLLVDALTDDPALNMDLVVSTPALANAVTLLCHRLLAQFASAPPELIRELAPRLVGEYDARRLGETVGRALALALRATDSTDGVEAVGALGDGFAEGLAAALEESELPPDEVLERGVRWGLERTAALADPLRRLARDDPRFVRETVGPLARAWRDVTEVALDDGEADHD
jgi:hypothetical protein